MKRRFHPADIAARIFSAVVGGYAFTLLSARAATSVLPLDGGEAAIATSLAAWVLFVAAILWAFAARTWLLAMAPLGLSALLFAVMP